MQPCALCSENVTEHLVSEIQGRMTQGRFEETRAKWEALQLFGIKRGNTFSGHASGGAGIIQVQASGTRIVATCKLDELWSQFSCTSLANCMESFQNVTPDYESLEALTTLGLSCVLPGDVFMLPQGYVTVEKAVNEHNIGFRALSHMIFYRLEESMRIFHLHLARNYGTEVMCNAMSQAMEGMWKGWSPPPAAEPDMQKGDGAGKRALPGPSLPLDSHPDEVRKWHMDGNDDQKQAKPETTPAAQASSSSQPPEAWLCFLSTRP